MFTGFSISKYTSNLKRMFFLIGPAAIFGINLQTNLAQGAALFAHSAPLRLGSYTLQSLPVSNL